VRRLPIIYAIRIVLIVFIITLSTQYAFAAQGLTKVANNIYSYVDTRQMSPQNSFGANAGIVIGRDGILVVDTLVSAKEAKRFIADIKAVSDKPIRYVVNTHYHLDHTFGNAEFVKLGAVIISHSTDRQSLERKGEIILKNAGGYGLSEQDMEGTEIALPSITFSDSMEIDLGDRKVRLIHTSASHTEGSILVYLPDSKVLFAGDILFTGYHPYMADGDLNGWAATLDEIVKMDVAAIIPGHGPISGKKDVAEMKEYLSIFDGKASELCAKSNDVAYIASELKKAVPVRAEGERLITANIQRRYLKAAQQTK